MNIHEYEFPRASKALSRRLNRIWLKRHFNNDKNGSHLEEYERLRQEFVEMTQDSFKRLSLEPIVVDATIKTKDLKRLIAKNLPLVVRDFANQWRAVEEWDFNFFIEHYGEIEIPLFNNIQEMVSADYDLRIDKFGSILEAINRGEKEEYPRFLNLINEYPKLQEAVDLNTLKKLRTSPSYIYFFQLFIGYEGSRSKMHSAIDHNFFVQIYGEKQWIIYPCCYNHYLMANIDRAPYFTSDFDFFQQSDHQYQCMQEMPYYEVTLRPGDMLFNPAFFWHDVINLNPSIGLGFRWFNPIDIVKLDLTKTLLTVCAFNPPFWKTRPYRKNGLQYYVDQAKLRARNRSAK